MYPLPMQPGPRAPAGPRAPRAGLLACRRTAKAADKQLVVVGLPQGLQSMAALYGVDGLLTDASSPS